MADNSILPWDRLGGAALEAARRGDTQRATELAYAARAAWLSHCEAVYAQERARSRIRPHSVWTRDEEMEM